MNTIVNIIKLEKSLYEPSLLCLLMIIITFTIIVGFFISVVFRVTTTNIS